jgi:hypothetical protein
MVEADHSGMHLTVKPCNYDRDDDHPPFVEPIARSYRTGGMYRPDTDTVRRAYRSMAQVNEDLFDRIPVDVHFTESDPYEDYEDMNESVYETGVLKIFSGGSEPEFLTRQQNLKGRAVHDWYGHLGHNCDFSVEGEVTKWYNMCDVYSPKVCQLLFAEVVGQVCVVHTIGSFDYEQRPILAPSSWIERVCDYYSLPVPDGYDYHDVELS